MNGAINLPKTCPDRTMALSGGIILSAAWVFAAVQAKDEPKSVTNSLGMKMVLIAKGEFLMGSEELPSEKPIHKVRLTKDFYLAANLITVGQFRSFVKDTGHKSEPEASGKGAEGYIPETGWVDLKPAYTWQKPGFDQADDHPVVCVSWNDAVAFCNWLSKKEGKTYRLATEAEFEYACRAGTTTRFSCGESNDSLKGYANLADASWTAKTGKKPPPGSEKDIGIVTWDDGYAFTSPVGKFKPNPWGLYDMHGNVWQWCNDWGSPQVGGMSLYYKECAQKMPMDDPPGPEKGAGRCIRGGAWLMGAVRCRSANRVLRDPGKGYCYVGFRLACTAE